MPVIGTPSYAGRCFVMQPFDKGTFEKRYKDVFEPAIRAAGLEPYRIDGDPSADVLIDEIEKGIQGSQVCFAEITTDNPNVWYELGYAVASGKPICMACSDERTTNFPFDVRHRNINTYKVASISDFEKVKAEITARLIAMLKKQKEIGTLSTLKSTTQTQGLTPHEIAVITLIMGRITYEGLPSWQLQREMTEGGFTEIATAIAVTKLLRNEFIAYVMKTDQRDGEDYKEFSLTPKGTDWLLANEEKLIMKKTPTTPTQFSSFESTPVKDDDIPF
jgi:hypothetical protein